MLNFSEFSGSPYHIGLALGKAGASAMHDLITPSALWQQLLLWRDSDELRALQDQVQQHHPYIWDELQGLARGLELPPDDVFLWNVQGTLPQRCPQDIDNAGHPDTDPETDAHAALGADADAEVHEGVDTNRPIGYTAVESTTLLIPTAEGPRIVHHMAGDPAVADCCGVAEFIVDQGPEFAAFVSPGMLPGHAVTVTGSGLCIAVNATLPQELGKGVPAIVLTRALLNMPDISSAMPM